jgi:hypothetical protein
MTVRTPAALRILAARFREMAQSGSDWTLQAALCQLAEDFEREADRVIISLDAPAPAFPDQPNYEELGEEDCPWFIRSSSS